MKIKKFVGLLIVFSLLMSFLPVFGAPSEDLSLRVNVTDFKFTDKTKEITTIAGPCNLSASFNIERTIIGEKDQEFVAVLSLLKDNKIEKLTTVNGILKKGEGKKKVEFESIKVPDGKYDANVIIYNNLADLIPLSPVATIDNKNSKLHSIVINDDVINVDSENEFNITKIIESKNYPPKINVRPYDMNTEISYKEIENEKGSIVITADAKGNKNTYKVNYDFTVVNPSSLKNIKIDGKEISDFKATKYDYRVELSYNDMEKPIKEITAEPFYSDSKVEITNISEYPGVALIKVTASDNTVSEYKISFVTPPKGNVTLKKRAGGEYPWAVGENLKLGDEMYNLNPNQSSRTYTNIKGFDFEGASYIKTNVKDTMLNIENDNQEWETIEIDNSADIYVVSVINPGSAWMRWIDKSYELIEGAKVTGSTNQDYKYIYKKSINVKDGEKASFTVGGPGKWLNNVESNMFTIIIKWKHNGEDIKPEPPKPLGKDVRLKINPSFWTVDKDLQFGDNLYTTDKENVPEGTVRTYEDFGGLDLQGAIAIQTNNNDASKIDGKYVSPNDRATWASMEIGASADIYVLSPYTVGSNWLRWLDDGKYTLLKNKVKTNVKDSKYNYNVYKKHITVEEGKTEIINMGGAGYYNEGKMYTVIVKWNDKEEDTSPVEQPDIKLITNPSNWEIANDLKIGTPCYVNEPDGKGKRQYYDFAGLPLEGATVLQTNYKDPVNADCKNDQKTWVTAEIIKNCDIYILTPYGVGQNWLRWVTKDGYELIKNEGGSEVKVKGSTGMTYKVYKKAFEASPLNKLTVNFGGIGLYNENNMYTVIIKWK